jgi:hypothetical protein
MTEIIKKTLISKNQGVPIASSIQKQLIRIQGTLTSSIQTRGENSQAPYYYSFIRLKGQSIDLPVIFKIKENENLTKPELKRNDNVELTGHYSNSLHSIRKSFTCSAYQILSEMQSFVGDQKRIRKKCIGCLDIFTCSQSKNYDYCSSCELNGNRYLNKDSPCPECDDSGLVKFKGQPPRNCELCYLTNQQEKNIFTK